MSTLTTNYVLNGACAFVITNFTIASTSAQQTMFYLKILVLCEMELLSFDFPQFKLVKTNIKIRVVELTSIGFGIGKSKKYSLSDSSYGEWLIYDGHHPKYYFYSFKKNGELNAIAKYVKENNLEFEGFLVNLLKARGYNANMPIDNNLQLDIERKSYIEEFELLQIVDL